VPAGTVADADLPWDTVAPLGAVMVTLTAAVASMLPRLATDTTTWAVELLCETV
jgi:hypothetical protein